MRCTLTLVATLRSDLEATLALLHPTMLSSLGHQMLALTKFGAERPHFYRTTPYFQSFGTTVSHVKVWAPAMSFDSLQSTLSLFGLRSFHVKSDRFTIAPSVALSGHTLSSKLSDAKNSIRVLLSSKLTLRFVITAFGLCFSLWFRSRQKT